MTAPLLPRPGRARADNPGQVRGGDAVAAHLVRLRWAVRAVLTLGVTASIAANVLHARPNLISQIIAAWPPLALLLTVELISRVPADRRTLAAARLVAAAGIAGIAAWVSYWHMVGVAARHGESGAAAAYLLPISVDGLVVVASISLVEIAGRIHAADPHPHTVPVQAVGTGGQRLGRKPAATGSAADGDAQTPAAAPPDASIGHAHPAGPLRDADVGTGASDVVDRDADSGSTPPTRLRPNGLSPQPTARSGARRAPAVDDDGGDGDGGRDGGVPSDTAAAVAFWYRADPGIHPAQIAAKIGRSERTVRRYLPPAARHIPGGRDAGPMDERRTAS